LDGGGSHRGYDGGKGGVGEDVVDGGA